jgi:hypothetical protein
LGPKHSGNAAHALLLNVALENVTPPYLHLLLGIVKKHHSLLEKACQDIDEAIAREMAKNSERPEEDTVFAQYVDSLIDLMNKN